MPPARRKSASEAIVQGQYYDRESGLSYNRFRYYDGATGQFISQDPIGLAGGINPYQFAPNVLGWIDPLGLSCQEAEAQSELARLQANAGSNSHFYDRHGAHLSDASLLQRTHTGLTPDGVSGPIVDSTRFTSHVNQLESAQRAQNIMNRFGSSVGTEVITFDAGREIGVGYGRLGSILQSSSSVKAVFRDGNLITMYPTF